jgi:hypothetical protein
MLGNWGDKHGDNTLPTLAPTIGPSWVSAGPALRHSRGGHWQSVRDCWPDSMQLAGRLAAPDPFQPHDVPQKLASRVSGQWASAPLVPKAVLWRVLILVQGEPTHQPHALTASFHPHHKGIRGPTLPVGHT